MHIDDWVLVTNDRWDNCHTGRIGQIIWELNDGTFQYQVKLMSHGGVHPFQEEELRLLSEITADEYGIALSLADAVSAQKLISCYKAIDNETG